MSNGVYGGGGLDCCTRCVRSRQYVGMDVVNGVGVLGACFGLLLSDTKPGPEVESPLGASSSVCDRLHRLSCECETCQTFACTLSFNKLHSSTLGNR